MWCGSEKSCSGLQNTRTQWFQAMASPALTLSVGWPGRHQWDGPGCVIAYQGLGNLRDQLVSRARGTLSTGKGSMNISAVTYLIRSMGMSTPILHCVGGIKWIKATECPAQCLNRKVCNQWLLVVQSCWRPALSRPWWSRKMTKCSGRYVDTGPKVEKSGKNESMQC